ncbi:MAG: OmpA family protein [Bacteroidales bacterium]|jgi:peptidoglycan-associated lipoprotein|nr:OmpA family protein [Bacteroidales bacterium]
MFCKRLLLLTFTLLISVWVTAQSGKYFKAEAMFKAGGYAQAAVLYKEAYDRSVNNNELKAEILYKMGNCYRLISNPKKAANTYKKAIRKKYPDPIVFLHYGDALLQLGDYETAKEAYEKFSSLRPDDKKGKKGLKACELAELWSQNPSGYLVDNVRPWNTKYSDFSPSFGNSETEGEEGKNMIVFTSSRENATGKKVSNVTGEKFSDIFFVELNRGTNKWSKPAQLNKNFNSEYDDGSTSFSGKGDNIYFTRCLMKRKGKLGCSIYTAKKEEGEWDMPTKIKLGSDSTIIAHPSISPDGLTMFFTADLPGGFGNKDIWKVTRSGEKADWGQPENLGSKINTYGNEMYPYIRDNKEFYFSSDGHEGMGGLDIFRAKLIDKEYLIENMRYPMNSSFDDFGVIIEENKEKGYFTSNRSGGRGSDDIWSFYLPPVRIAINGIVTDVDTEEPLKGVTVKLLGSDNSTINHKTSETGRFRFAVKRNTKYIIIASRENYLKGQAKKSTVGLTGSKTFETHITMKSYEKPIEIPNILYDFGKWELRSESTKELDKLIEILNENDNLIIELGAHTDSRGNDETNNELSKKRAVSVVEYLIKQGISKERLRSKGYGSIEPKEVSKNLAKQYPFLLVGSKLTDEYINKLPNAAQQEIAHQANRRTEFRVISTEFESNKK